MSVQTLHREEFFPTERAESPSQEDHFQWKVQPIRKFKKHTINVTNVNQDIVNENHVEDHNLHDHDVLSLDDQMTMASSACTFCDNSTGVCEINHINKEHEHVYNKVTVTNKVYKNCGKRIRGGRKNPKHMNIEHEGILNIFSTNAAGLVNGKIDSLKSEVKNMKSNIITVQETHFRKKANFKSQILFVLKLSEQKKVVAHF